MDKAENMTPRTGSSTALHPNADWEAIREWRKQARTRLIQQRIGISTSIGQRGAAGSAARSRRHWLHAEHS